MKRNSDKNSKNHSVDKELSENVLQTETMKETFQEKTEILRYENVRKDSQQQKNSNKNENSIIKKNKIIRYMYKEDSKDWKGISENSENRNQLVSKSEHEPLQYKSTSFYAIRNRGRRAVDSVEMKGLFQLNNSQKDDAKNVDTDKKNLNEIKDSATNSISPSSTTQDTNSEEQNSSKSPV